MSKRLTIEEFINRAKKVHGDKYDYSLVKYIDTKTKVEVICKKHGSFFISPAKLFIGRGCKSCYLENKSEISRKSKIKGKDLLYKTDPDLCEELKFKKDSKKYTRGSHKKVQWVCKTCNYEWSASIVNRSRGRGCPKCSGRVIIDDNCIQTTHPELCKELKFKEDGKKYSKGSNKRVEWICIKCDYEWQAIIRSRALGSGCPKCSNKIVDITNCLKTTNYNLYKELKFESDGLKYTEGSQKKVDWKCFKCDYEWSASIVNRSRGRGCPRCSNSIEITIESFIEKAIKVHGDKYDYSLVDYKGYGKKVKIICKQHGMFEQQAGSHLSGCGCSKCAGVYRYDSEEFIEKCRKIHGGKYDYSLVNYKSNHKKVKIICPEHGVLEILPSNHLRGHECIYCSDTNLNKTTEQFIEEAKKVHGDLYDYSKVDYKNCKTKVEIICKKHGSFWQSSNNHLSGKGCLQCASKNLVGKREEQLYNLLKPHFKSLKSQFRVNKFSVDFSIVNKNTSHILLIEYDEEDHYKQINNPSSNYYLPLQLKRQKKIIKTLKKQFSKVSFIRIPDINPEEFENDLEEIANYLKTYINKFLTQDLPEKITDPEFIWNLFSTAA